MTDETTAQRQEELARARSAARSMSDPHLLELHQEGSSAFAPGAWQVLDEEIRRRERVKARRPSVIPSDESERYPALRTIVFLLKGIAVLVALIAVLGTASSVVQVREGGLPGILAGVLILIAGTIVTITYWAAAELLVLLMDIEANTRAIRRE